MTAIYTVGGTGYSSLATALANQGAVTVTGTAADLSDAALADLEANSARIASITISGTDNLSLTGSKLSSYKDVILKLSAAKLDVTDTAAGLSGNNFSTLDAVYSKINAITVSDAGPVSVAYRVYSANAHEQAIETLIRGTGNKGIAVTNFSGNASALGVLISDADVKSISLKDSIANLTTNATAINGSSKIASNSITVSDTLANINDAAAKTLVGTTLATKVSSVAISMGAGDLTTENMATINALPDAIKSKVGISISDNIANLSANVAAINSNTRVASSSITVSDTLANINATAAKTLIGTTLASKVASVVISIAAADVTSANLQTIFALPDAIKSKVTFNITGSSSVSIPVSMSATDVSPGNLAVINSLPDGFKSNLSISITGSAADLIRNSANITALGSKVSSIVGTDASIANLSTLSSLKNKFTAIGITDIGANLAQVTTTNHTALGDAITSWTAGKISGVKISTIPTSASLTTVLSTVTGNSISVSLSDTAANLNKDLASASSVIGSNIGNLLTVAVTDGTALKKAALNMSSAQYTALKTKLTGQNTFILSGVAYADYGTVRIDPAVLKFSVQDTYENLASADLPTMLINASLLGVKITNTAVADVSTISAQYAALAPSIRSKLNSVTVTDTSANLLGNASTLPSLRSNNLIKNIYATGASIANVLTLKSNPKVSGITVSDTEANFKLTANASLVAYTKITGFSLTAVSTTSLTGTNNYLTNSKITSIDVADSLTNINGISDTIMNNTKLHQITANGVLIGDISALNSKDKVTSINVSDSWANIKTYFAGAGATQNTKVKSFTIAG
ncbi:hypothetical protein [Polynucleobacter sp. MG-6-Vaara-E2]|uniref:beta strand repeat-containing protein n=1 Tax=Polynucleobacter sp. MG-6-Vaara-E2 TaxID=2576932 RepID=UPI001BFEAFFD|nr:hypothetical protein [Polynucleobacter sp. MG-6-Vaara-E2]QWD96000.1 hypothetical protein ICV38_06960 [Polynucleobacter sp. MG-6-Vaara-E2]